MDIKKSSDSPLQKFNQTQCEFGVPITISHLTKRYAQSSLPALCDLTFTIEPGILGLLGRNGAGKTTLLQILATLMSPTQGEVRIGSYDVRKDRQKIRSQVGIGYLPQEMGFYPKLTVKETLHYLAVLQNLEKVEYAVGVALASVNLQEKARERVSSLSGGMRRRLGLAAALLGDPRILIVDEPTTGLDPVEQQRFRLLLGSLAGSGNRTILLSTHIVSDISSIAQNVVVLERGKTAFQGNVQQLAEQARGFCWEWQAPLEKIEALQAQGTSTVSSLQPHSSLLMQARVVGSRPDESAFPCDPTVEDGYFKLLHLHPYSQEQSIERSRRI